MWQSDKRGILCWDPRAPAAGWWFPAWLLFWHHLGTLRRPGTFIVRNSIGIPAITMRFGPPMEARFASRREAEGFIKTQMRLNRSITDIGQYTIEEIGGPSVP